MTGTTDNWMADLAAPLLSSTASDPGAPLPLPAIPQALEAVLLLGINHGGQRALIWVTDGPQAMDIMARNLRTLDDSGAAVIYSYPPAAGDNPAALPAVFAARDRLTALTALTAVPQRPLIILTCIEAVLQPCPPREVLRQQHRILKVKADCGRQDLTGFLQRTGHRFVQEVQTPGQVAVRGGLLDIWPIGEPHPFRVELFGENIESIRIFDPADQRSIATRSEMHVGLAAENALSGNRKSSVVFADYLPPSAIVVWSRYADIEKRLALIREDAPPDSTARWPQKAAAALLREASPESAESRPKGARIFIPAPSHWSARTDLLPDDLAFIEGVTAPSNDGFQPDAADRQRRMLVRRLAAAAAAGKEVRIYFNTSGALTHFRKTFGAEPAAAKIHCLFGWLSDGFELPSAGRMFLGEDLLYGRGRVRRLRPSIPDSHWGDEASEAKACERLAQWHDLRPGDLVVHAAHGIGRYTGTQTVESGATAGEYLAVMYAAGARLLVPVSQVHLLSRYIGAPRHGVKLHQLGGTRWNRERHAAHKAIEDLAATFVEIQAARQTLPGHAFSADTPWLPEFEAAFPFEETVDQQQAIADVMRDMEAPRPMDRLICGDAGYGKTEVAMRAAFKAVMDGRQVAVFVPTTVLAQQHYYTFNERMGPYPLTIEMLSRFSSAADRRRVSEGLRSGATDIVIGTHALLNSNLQFRDLGLVVIDEEQRFGVMQKERFKHIRRMLDVLTLTATPIPRTLYLSLTGVREMSAIRTPPRDRLAIETEISEDRDDIVRQAILRELRRDGQVYFLHNRIQSIERVHKRLSVLVPEARIETAHGRMAAKALADKMRRFAEGRFDVLLCTTIIESGVDIPTVNTIIVDRADRFGLADLYQLRGRVGRSDIRAHALLLLARHGLSDPQIRKRVGALREYGHPGAGFELALRDLEIRGAGNLLGSEQSGHIAAIGFNLYCQILQRTVSKLKGEPVPPLIEVELKLDFLSSASDAGISATLAVPPDYIARERERMRIYRRMAEAADSRQVEALRDELRDRFGPPPRALQRLLAVADLRIAAAARGIRTIETDGAKVMMSRADGYIMTGGRFPRLAGRTPDERLAALRKLVDDSA